MTKVKWPKEFSPNEWPGDTASKLDPRVLKALFKVREYYGQPMQPSPLERAHIREEEGTSRHQAPAHDATDLFLPTGDIAGFLKAAQRVSEVGGIGIYLNRTLGGRALPMVHIDTRPGERLLWIQKDRNSPYVYEVNDPKMYYQLLYEAL